jgi:hypothetical protein
MTMDIEQYQGILEEAEKWAHEGYVAAPDIGLLHCRERHSVKRVSPEVWFAVRAIQLGQAIAATYAQANAEFSDNCRRAGIPVFD